MAATSLKIPAPLVRSAEATGGLAVLAGHSFLAMVRPPYQWRLWMQQMELIGVQSLGVAYITTFFTGMVLALQTAYSLPTLGVKYYIGTVVSKSLVRELGPVLVALVVGGRIGAGMTAELGTMKVTEQIDALRSMAVDPVKRLVVPKLVATLFMLPALTVLGDVMGILGGLFIAVTQLDLTAGFYVNDVLSALTMGDVWNGIGKSFFFAYAIAIIGCWHGLEVRGGADGVGRATTHTVVLAAVTVLISDFFLTKFFHLLS
ncbi:MAG TPA: ABC transporter permease [Thermoanaerobaculia bacterium]|nr:ABC transporter permease [Thermoanaerobaculia bacterium]